MWAGIIKAIAAFFGFGEKVAEIVHDHNVDVAGQNKIISVENAAKASVNADVAKAAVDTSDSVALGKLLGGDA